MTGTTVILAVVDDGIGFDVADLADAPADGRLGLLLLHDLVRAAAWSFRVASGPLGGTKVQAAVVMAPAPGTTGRIR